VPVARRDRDEEKTFLTALAELYVSGVDVAWGGPGPRADLPGYPFEHRRFWPPARQGDARGATGHPLLGGVLDLGASGTAVCTGRLSPAAQPWLADHSIFGSIVLPGTAFLELARHLGAQVGCERVDELTLLAPLVLADDAATTIQVSAGPADDAGNRPVEVHSQAEGGTWTRHATGVLAPATPVAAADTGAWPPAGAVPVDLTDAYPRLADRGFAYGPVFQGLTALWRREDELFAEVRLDDPETSAFGLHPALLDAALHPTMVADPDGKPALPFTWRGVSLHRTGAADLRVRLAPAGPDTISIAVTDTTGAPVASVDGLTVREPAPGRLRANHLYRLAWTPLSAAPAAEVTAPDHTLTDPARALDDLAALGTDGPVVVTVPSYPGDPTAATRAATTAVLALLQAWLADPRFDDVLVLRTSGALTGDDLAAAAVWGLVRSARQENPGRFVLADSDGSAPLRDFLGAGEPELSIRDGVASTARLDRATAGPGVTEWDPDRTVLVTGGTGGLGALVARRLAAGGQRKLLLVSRSGTTQDGLEDDLRALGAETTVAACDVGDRAALAPLLDGVDLTAVVHAAGVLDDGVVGSLTPDRFGTVLRPKADGAWHLHELTAGQDLAGFVLFSSLAGTIGGAGQANYAAANAFLDALAVHRHAHGLPAVSLAWGPWTPEAGMTAALPDAEIRRLARAGVELLAADDGLAVFDAVRAGGEPLAVPVHLNLPVLRGQDVPPVLRKLIPPRRTAAAGPARADLAPRLAGLSPADRIEVLLDVVADAVAVVLEHGPEDVVGPDQAFTGLGFDSLTAVELRRRLEGVTGLQLPATLAFDQPTPRDLAGYLAELVAPEEKPEQAILADLARLEKVLQEAVLEPGSHEEITVRLEQLRGTWTAREDVDGDEFDFDAASDDEVFALLDEKLGADRD
jgi:acyl transferase domain-containing protein/acyl carrier protein